MRSSTNEKDDQSAGKSAGRQAGRQASHSLRLSIRSLLHSSVTQHSFSIIFVISSLLRRKSRRVLSSFLIRNRWSSIESRSHVPVLEGQRSQTVSVAAIVRIKRKKKTRRKTRVCARMLQVPPRAHSDDPRREAEKGRRAVKRKGRRTVELSAAQFARESDLSEHRFFFVTPSGNIYPLPRAEVNASSAWVSINVSASDSPLLSQSTILRIRTDLKGTGLETICFVSRMYEIKKSIHRGEKPRSTNHGTRIR